MPPRLPLSLAVSLLLLFACESNANTRRPDERSPSGHSAPSDGPKLGAAVGDGDGEYTLPYGDQTIYVYADPSLGVEVERLFELLGDLHDQAVPIDATTRLPIGWTTLSFAVEGEHDERLVAVEPDYSNQPETRTRRDISVSLATLARQRAVLEHADVAGEAINFDQHAIAIRGTLELDEIMLLRVDSPGGRMTGWRITPTAGIAEQDELESLPVYAILEARPALLDAMLLPAGYMVFYVGEELTTIVNERDEVVWDWNLDGAELERGPARERAKPLLEPID